MLLLLHVCKQHHVRVFRAACDVYVCICLFLRLSFCICICVYACVSAGADLGSEQPATPASIGPDDAFATPPETPETEESGKLRRFWSSLRRFASPRDMLGVIVCRRRSGRRRNTQSDAAASSARDSLDQGEDVPSGPEVCRIGWRDGKCVWRLPKQDLLLTITSLALRDATHLELEALRSFSYQRVMILVWLFYVNDDFSLFVRFQSKMDGVTQMLRVAKAHEDPQCKRF